MEQDKILNVAIVGGGPGCKAIMDVIFAQKLSELRMRLIGIADINPEAVGYRYAQEKGIFTTQDYRELFKLPDLSLVVEVTGQDALANEIFRTKPEHVRLMGNVAARLFWDIFRIEEKRIAERKRAESALREDRRFLQNVFDAMQEGITVVDCDFNIIRINPWVEKAFVSQAPLVGRKCYEAYQIGGSPCLRCPLKGDHSQNAGAGQTICFQADGDMRWIDLAAFPLKNAEGQVVGVIERMKDITEHRRAEEELRESEAQKRAILDASIDMIRYVDKEMKIIWANERTLQAFGLRAEDAAGQACYRLFLKKEMPCEGCPTEKALGTGRMEHAVMRKFEFAERPGESYWDCYGVPVKKSGQIVRLIQMARDVTEQKKAEKELERRHHELEAINAVLLRMTKEYSLDGMCRVLQDMVREFYPGFETWMFLLTPQRNRLYFPRPEEGGMRETCYDRAERRLRSLNLEEALLRLLTMEEIRPTYSGDRQDDCPATIQELVLGLSTWMAVPIELEGQCHGLFVLGSSSVDIDIEKDLVFVQAVIQQISGVVRYQIAKEVREEAFREQLAGPDKFMGIVGRSRPMQKIYRMIQSVADSGSTVLITGESGTGKELVARAIHRAGRYKDTPFVVAHCSSFVPTLVHSEIFGHERGAFTGAISRKRGRLERAQGGILFLDEVADLPLETQVLLLRFLQDRSFERVGGERLLEVNVRVIAATNKDIEKEMKAGRLREDFYYRLNVLPVRIPALRERVADVPLLANHFLRTYCLIEGKEISGFETDAMRMMMDYDWPGNIRELQNMVARCVVLSSGGRIGAEVLPDRIRKEAGVSEFSLAENEMRLILQVMQECKWNKHEAARRLGISRGTLYSKLRRHHIKHSGIN